MDARLAIDVELARRELARRNYSDYLAYANGAAWKRTRMAEFIAHAVQRFLETDTGHAYDILAISAPPQHGKSASLSEALPSWYLGKHPKHHVILASYDSDYAEKFCRKNKEKIRAVGNNLFGIRIGSTDRASDFDIAGGGRMISRGIMSGITGNPANLILIDDPIKNQQEADSETYRARLWNEWQASLKTRLAAKGKVIVIMTRWHEEDFLAQIIETERSVTYLRLPIEAEENDPLGRAVGDALCPELGKDNEWLKDFKSSYVDDPKGGRRAWLAMYQCTPRAEEGNLIRRDWWKRYDGDRFAHGAGLPQAPNGASSLKEGAGLRAEVGTSVISVDATFKGGDSSDFVAIQVWTKIGKDYFLRYSKNQRLNFPETVNAIRAIARLYPEAQWVLIEEAANGAAIIETLQRELNIIPVKPKGGKVSRVNAVSAAIEGGHVFLPQDAAWVEEYIDQWTVFPNGKHDDMVDATSQALHWMIWCNGSGAEETAAEIDLVRLFEPYERDGNGKYSF